MPSETKFVGTFIAKNHLVITDPCYDILSTWCLGILDNALPGEWRAYITYEDHGSWGVRVKELKAFHKDYCYSSNGYVNEVADFVVGVDSGQAGIFNVGDYPVANDGENTFYEKCCALTLDSDAHGGVLDGGVVASTGFGDGTYQAILSRNRSTKEIVGVTITFIDDKSSDEEG